jgi:hypothetical protein
MGATADWRDYENNFNLVAMIVVEPLIATHAADAHGIAGNRYFDGTLSLMIQRLPTKRSCRTTRSSIFLRNAATPRKIASTMSR